MNNTYHSYNVKLEGENFEEPGVVHRVDNCHIEPIEGTGALGIWRKDPATDYDSMRMEACYAPGTWISFELIIE